MTPALLAAALLAAVPLLVTTPKSTIILLESNKSSAVDVKTAAGSVTLDRPFTATDLTDPAKNPALPKPIDPAALTDRYGTLLGALPPAPSNVLFYFEEGTADLTEASKTTVGELERLIRMRQPCAVDIVGHSDTAGDARANELLALRRAEAVKTFLDARHLPLEHVNVRSYGEADPLIPTGDGVAEPRNRRVEVIIR